MPSTPFDARTQRPTTRLTQAGRNESLCRGAVNVPVVHASSIGFPSVAAYEAAEKDRFNGLFYGRYGTPTAFALEEAVAEMEGGYRALAVPSGVAAISLAILSLVKPGDHILVVDSCYGPTRGFCEGYLKELGVETTYFPAHLGGSISGLLRPNTRLVFGESPGSGTFEVMDLQAISGTLKGTEVALVIDNTWATPCFLRAFDHGVAFSIHSATKYIGGHSDLMMGLVVADEAHYEPLRRTAAFLGLCVGPDDCYLALRGLRSLRARLEMHQRNALAVARWLEARGEVARVLYPALESAPGHAIWRRDFSGASGLFSFELAEPDPARLTAIADGLELFCLGASWGGYESMVLPVKAPRSCGPAPVEGAILRLHIGLEDPADLIADLEQALTRAVSWQSRPRQAAQ